MNYSNNHFKKLLMKPINILIDEIVNNVLEMIIRRCKLSSRVQLLSPIQNFFYKRNIKYSIKDYVIGIIDVLKNNISRNSYSGLIQGNTLRKNIMNGSNWEYMSALTKIHLKIFKNY